jgi:hypothetical protein
MVSFIRMPPRLQSIGRFGAYPSGIHAWTRSLHGHFLDNACLTQKPKCGVGV